jgi:predicted Fe-Mo cluster-binding NifX family protein
LNDKVVIPTENQQGLNARLAEHFGRAPYYTIIEIDENGEISNVKTVPNIGEHAGGTGYSHDNLLQYQPNAIVVFGMGPRGLSAFQNAGIAVLKTNANTVSEVMEAYKKHTLLEQTEGCEHAHHKEQHHH